MIGWENLEEIYIPGGDFGNKLEKKFIEKLQINKCKYKLWWSQLLYVKVNVIYSISIYLLITVQTTNVYFYQEIWCNSIWRVGKGKSALVSVYVCVWKHMCTCVHTCLKSVKDINIFFHSIKPTYNLKNKRLINNR